MEVGKSPLTSRRGLWRLLTLTGTLIACVFLYAYVTRNRIFDEEVLHPQQDSGVRSFRRGRNSVFFQWTGVKSEAVKKHPIARFCFLFYEHEPEDETVDPPTAVMQRLSRELWDVPLVFVTVGQRNFTDTFSNVLSPQYFEINFPSAVIVDVPDGFRKYGVTLNTTAIDDADMLEEILRDELLAPYFGGDMHPILRNEEMDTPDFTAKEFVDDSDYFTRINSHIFHQVLLNESANVPGVPKEFIIQFHSPWCGHCRRLQARLEPLAKQMMIASDGHVRMFRLDASINDVDHPDIRLSRVPVMMFFQISSNTTVVMSHRAQDYEDDEYLKEFLLTHLHSPAMIRAHWAGDEEDEL